MFCSVFELARLSLAAYRIPPEDVAPWRMIREFPRTDGFYAALYQNQMLNVLAFRGTDDGYDIVPDIQTFQGQVPNQFAAAEVALRTCRTIVGAGAKLAVTGHSLGGGLAQLIAAKRGLPAVTFNAPGVSRSYVASVGLGGVPAFGAFASFGVVPSLDYDWIINIRANGDVVSVGTGPRIGKVMHLPLTGCGLTLESRSPAATARTASLPGGGFTSVDGEAIAELARGAASYVLCQHSMVQMVRQLKNMEEYRKPLDWFGPMWSRMQAAVGR